MSEPYYSPSGSDSPGGSDGQESDPGMAQMFVLVLGVAVVFLFIYFYLPSRKGKQAEPKPAAAKKGASNAEWDRYRDEMVAEFSNAAGTGGSPEEIERMLNQQLGALKNDPNLSKDQQMDMERRLKDIARQSGS